jgi:hypothetical protein
MAALEPSRLGNWASTRPEDAACWFSSLTVPWWIAGGWALDLFLGRQFREHGDLDVGVLRRDSPQLLAALSNWEIFEAQNGVFRRRPQIRRPLNEVIRRTPQGVPYLAPEVQLLYKARAPRLRDHDDFAHVVPHLEAPARTWLRESLQMTEPEHGWLVALA